MRPERYLAFCLFVLSANSIFAVTISTTLDGTAPPPSPDYIATTGLQTGRLNRFSPRSDCDSPKANPGLFVATGDRRYDAYVFTAALTGCMKMTYTGGTSTIFAVVYNGSGFVASNPSTNYLADPTASPSATTETAYFNVIAGQQFTIVISEVNVGAGVNTGYTLTIDPVIPQSVATTLDGIPPPSNPAYVATTAQQTGRLTRNGGVSDCTSQKPNPGLGGTTTGPRQFDLYRFIASRSGCVTVSLSQELTSFFVVAYNSAGFVPATPDLNYLADPGVSSRNSKFSFEVTALQEYTVVVHEVNTGGAFGANYTLRVTEAVSQTPYDFDGDNETDIGIFRPGTGQWWQIRSSTGSVSVANFGLGTDRIVPGDFSGDGRSDIAVWRPSTGVWFVVRSEDSAFITFPFGLNGDIPQPADFDADGRTDAAVFRPSTNTWFIRRSIDLGATIDTFGTAGDLPVTADYDGDGRSDIAIYRPSLGQWWIKRSTAGVTVLTFGNSLDKATQGDFTGDGRADVALWRPSTGEWFVLRSEDLSYYSFPFGTIGDVPAPGDFDGDGLFRPGNISSVDWNMVRTTQSVGFGVDSAVGHQW